MNQNNNLWNNIKWSKEKRKTLEKIVAGIFLNVMKAVNSQTKTVQQTSRAKEEKKKELIEKS